MARTPSTMLSLGTALPSFKLNDTEGKAHDSHASLGKNGLLVMFICNHCPFVVHVREGLVNVAHEALGRGIGVLAINSNDVINYPDDSPEKMREHKKTYNYPFAYLFDESQEVAKTFQAACTPDFYLFDGKGKLAYRGQLDDSRPGNNVPVTGKDLLTAILTVSEGKTPGENQKASLGCNIKWKVGNEPNYFLR